MRRRDFLKSAIVASSSSFLCDSAKTLALSASHEEMPPKDATAPNEVPDLDELAGDWISGSILEILPSLSNFHGSLQSSRNILAVEYFTLPPLAQGGQVAALSLNGKELAAQDFRWYPYQVLRKTQVEGLEILTKVRMPFEEDGTLFSVEATNLQREVRNVEIAIDFHTMIRQYLQTWTWETPRPGEKDAADFSSSVVGSKSDRIFLIQDRRSASKVAFVFCQEPEKILDETQNAVWHAHIKPGETFRLEFVMATGSDLDSVMKEASAWKENFTETWERAKAGWGQRFRAAFTPENGHFSGNLPTLITDDLKVRKMYYASVLSLLCLERTNLDPKFPRVFVTGGPQWTPSLVYFWDTSFFATVWALLDPLAMRKQLKLFLESDVHSCYAVDFLSLKPVGPWYSANDYSLFRLVTTYLYVTRDWQFLDEVLRNGQSAMDTLEGLSTHWRTLATPPSLLANYGNASNLLETVSTYVDYVPSMNAANVWMMRSMAKLRSRRGDAARAVQLQQQADKLAAEVLGLYVDGKGFWACRLSDRRLSDDYCNTASKCVVVPPKIDGGIRSVEVRHCIDFFTLIDTMQSDLGQRRIDEMIEFVNEELWTEHWLRALSLRDAAAKVAVRADHGSTGSYDAWPALTVEAFFRVGREREALARLRSLVPSTREGAFGQAHFVATQRYPVRKAGSNDYQVYFASASGAFAEIILRTIFGFAPDVDDQWQWSPPKAPGFKGQLTNVRYGGKLVSGRSANIRPPFSGEV